MKMPCQSPGYNGCLPAGGKGFTLVELLTTIAVAAILLSIAVPSFSTLIQNNRLITQTNDFVTALNLARSEAIKRADRVTVCTSSNGTSCTAAGAWDQGWIVFVDSAAAGAGATPAAANILRVHGPLNNAVTLKGTAGLSNYISYIASGASQLTSGAIQSGVLVMCDARGFVSDAKGIQLSPTGRVNTASATTTAAGSCL